MTSPVVVGSVAVEVTASARGFAKSLRDAVIKEFKGAGIDKALSDALSKRPIKVPVQPEFDGKAPSKRTPTDQLPDPAPLLKAFQEDVRRQVRSLSRQALKIPISADTEELRNGISATLEAIQRQSRAKIPTEPADRAEYERKLTAMVGDASKRIKARIPIEQPKPVRIRTEVDKSQLRQAQSAFSGIASAARSAAGAAALIGGIGALGGAAATGLAGLASAAGGAIQLLAGLAAAAGTASGALFALPGAAAVAAAGIGALALGFAGIGGAIKESAKTAGGGGGGGGLVNTARQIAQAQRGIAAAERGLVAAQRESRRAQEELNRARKAAIERIDDLSRALRGAQLDEREATIRVREALEDLDRAQRSGNLSEIEKAQLAYEQSVLALENAKDAAGDLADENADAAKRGVEGSDEVQAALERQQSAADSLASATDSLASAHEALAAAQEKIGGGGGGGVDRFAEAMAKLSPAAQELVRTIIALRPAWEAMQKAVQQSLLAGVARDFDTMARSTLPVLKTGLTGVAGVLNGQLRAGLKELSTANTRIQLGTIFDNAKRALGGLTVAVRPFIRALLDVSAVGSGVVADLTKGLGDWIKGVSERLSEMAKSGQLRAMIEDGLRTLAKFGKAAADVFNIVKGIFSAADAAGSGAGIFGLLTRLNDMVNSIAGQKALTEIFVNLGRIGDALMPVLLAIAQALGPVSGAIADIALAFAPTLVTLVQSLGGALASLAPAFISLAPLVSTLASGLQPLASILVALVVGAAPGINALLQGLVLGLEALAPVAPLVGQALGDIGVALAPLLPMIGQSLANALSIAAPLLSILAREMGPVIELLAGAFVGAFSQLMPVMLQFASIVLPLAAQAGASLARALMPLVPVLVQVAGVIAGQLAAFLPQFAQILVQLVPIIGQLALQFGQVLLAALLALMPHLPTLIQSALQLFLAFAQMLPVLLPLLPPLVQLATMMLQAALQSSALQVILKLMTFALQGATVVIRGITAVVKALVNPIDTAKSAASRMGTAIKDAAGRALGAIRELPGKIKSALGNVGNLLFQAGKNVVQGLIDGLYSMFGSLGGAASGLASTIRDYLPFSPAKKGPLSGRGNPYNSGRSIANLLATGVESNMGVVRSSAADLASQYLFAGDPLAGLPGVSAAGLPAPAATGGLEASWRLGSTGDPLLDAIRDAVRIRYGGDANLAFGRASTPQMAAGR